VMVFTRDPSFNDVSSSSIILCQRYVWYAERILLVVFASFSSLSSKCLSPLHFFVSSFLIVFACPTMPHSDPLSFSLSTTCLPNLDTMVGTKCYCVELSCPANFGILLLRCLICLYMHLE